MISTKQQEKAVRALANLLKVLGLDLSDKNYRKTPQRIFSFLEEFTSVARDNSIETSLKKNLAISFPSHKTSQHFYNDMLIQYPIKVFSLCSHHLLPIEYNIAFGYIPKKEKYVGFSKIIRALRFMAKKPMNQEDFTEEFIDLFWEIVQPEGCGIIVKGKHFCMIMRGARSNNVNITSKLKGGFKEDLITRNEFLSLINKF